VTATRTVTLDPKGTLNARAMLQGGGRVDLRMLGIKKHDLLFTKAPGAQTNMVGESKAGFASWDGLNAQGAVHRSFVFLGVAMDHFDPMQPYGSRAGVTAAVRGIVNHVNDSELPISPGEVLLWDVRSVRSGRHPSAAKRAKTDNPLVTKAYLKPASVGGISENAMKAIRDFFADTTANAAKPVTHLLRPQNNRGDVSEAVIDADATLCRATLPVCAISLAAIVAFAQAGHITINDAPVPGGRRAIKPQAARVAGFLGMDSDNPTSIKIDLINSIMRKIYWDFVPEKERTADTQRDLVDNWCEATSVRRLMKAYAELVNDSYASAFFDYAMRCVGTAGSSMRDGDIGSVIL